MIRLARLLDVSFRIKLLIALVGSVALLGLASLAVVRYYTDRQVESVVHRAADRALRALAEVERMRRADLERIAGRLTGSIRIAAALDAALGGADAGEFVDQVRYELTLAELQQGLVAFADRTGRPVVTLLNGERVADSEEGVDALAQAGADPEAVATGYRVFHGTLFAVQRHGLELFGESVGTLTIGFPVDKEVASRLGDIVEAPVCFAANGRCVAATPDVGDSALRDRMLDATRASGAVFTTVDDRRLALVSSPLPGAAGISAVVAVPLDDVLAPFDRIQFVEIIAAMVALGLALLLGGVLSKGLTSPIRTLVAATERVRRGDYDFSVHVPYRDELGTFADAFNQMTQGLLLKERYRGVLDKVVSPRVAEELMKGEIRLGGETREVTTLFADIRGFTALTEHIAPEQVIAMLNDWLELAALSIEEEGGVVDKYVGDEVMALFGAPMAQPDHALCAVRAALKLRERTEALNARRQARGDPPFSIGIGVNTGAAVAGNTGSSKRLNYTVLGASVNEASRLCSDAGPGEVLIAEGTYRRVAEQVDATPLPPRVFKGFSRPVTPYSVHAYRHQRPGSSAAASAPVALLVLSGLLLCPAAAGAQILEFPTLSELGVQYISPGGLVQVRPRLQTDLEGYFPQDAPAWHLAETDPFIAGRARLFVDVFVGRRVYLSTELRADRGQPARAGSLQGHLQQAFVRVTPVVGKNFTLQAGKFVSPFGSYPQRAHTAADPFIRPPLLYDYRTVLQADFVPAAVDGVFNWKNNPRFRPTGLPIAWEVPYPIGAMAGGGGRGWTLTAAVLNTAPSAEPDDWNRFDLEAPAGPSFIGRASYQVVPELQVGASYNRGAYMRPDVADDRGPVVVNRQLQETYALEANFTRGHVGVRGEVLFNEWQVFRTSGHPRDVSGYVEARVTLAPGLFAAVRYNAIRFVTLERASGSTDRWDYDVRRWQFGAGYRISRSTEIRGEYMINRTPGREDPSDNLLSLRWGWTF